MDGELHGLLNFKGTGHCFAIKDSLLANRCRLMPPVSLALFSNSRDFAAYGVWASAVLAFLHNGSSNFSSGRRDTRCADIDAFEHD